MLQGSFFDSLSPLRIAFSRRAGGWPVRKVGQGTEHQKAYRFGKRALPIVSQILECAEGGAKAFVVRRSRYELARCITGNACYPNTELIRINQNRFVDDGELALDVRQGVIDQIKMQITERPQFCLVNCHTSDQLLPPLTFSRPGFKRG